MHNKCWLSFSLSVLSLSLFGDCIVALSLSVPNCKIWMEKKIIIISTFLAGPGFGFTKEFYNSTAAVWERRPWFSIKGGLDSFLRCHPIIKLGQTPGDSEGQGGLAYFSPWDCKELDMTQWPNSNNKEKKKKQKIRRPQIRRLTLLFVTWRSSFQEFSLGPQSFVSLSPVERIQMTLFVWKLAYQRCHLCQKPALQWRERWLSHVDLTFLMPSNQKSVLAVLNCSSLLKIHHFCYGRTILGC